MNTAFHSLISTSTEACSTPKNGANPLLKRSGWTSSTADNERSTKRQNSDCSGSVLKRQKTPSTCLTRSNEQMSSRIDRHSLDTECNNDQEDMNESDLVAQRNVAPIQDGSPEDSELKVISEFSTVKSIEILKSCLKVNQPGTK